MASAPGMLARQEECHMTCKIPLTVALALAIFQISPLVRAEGRGEERREVRENRPPPRPAPPRFQPHPPGAHPHGPMVRTHPVRILAPRLLRRDEHPWRHWAHPEFARPAYYWNWATIRSVSCIAEDSYGDQYPVSTGTFPGFEMANMTAVEDQALDCCYDESGGDPNCFLLTCSHF